MKKQQGMTTLGMIIAVAVMGLIVYAGIRLTPVYLEAMKIEGVLNSVATELAGNNATIQEIRSAIGKRVDVEMISQVKERDFKVAKRGAGYQVSIEYVHTVPYLANVSFAVDFQMSKEIAR